ncbi:MAG: succinate dehydrogenase subunit C [marine bacterium B5-7]|nr:MAG: succinate dehydrogenase subunit C [marine bacterium B5-7]
MPTNRPVHLQMTTMRFPLTAIVSILHRVSGVLLFILLPVFLWGLGKSLSSAADYQDLIKLLANPLSRFVAWVMAASFIYHGCAGVRHLMMDLGHFESKTGAKRAAQLMLLIAFVLIAWVGVKLC